MCNKDIFSFRTHFFEKSLYLHKNNTMRNRVSNWSFIVLALLTLIMLCASIPILPTFDDWTSLTRPTFEPLFTKERWLFFGYHWRPFDSFFGYLLGLNPQLLFPLLNHCCVVIGHSLCSLLVFRVIRELGYSRIVADISMLFFFLAPATMATVLAVDSMNQTYALVWGLLSFLVYIRQQKMKYLIWIILIFIATLCKENGLMWALIAPILAFGYDLIGRQQLKKDLLIGIGVMVAYALVILLTPKDIVIHPEYEPGVLKTVGNIVKFLFTTFVTVDYVYLLHHPSRNLFLAILSLLPTLLVLFFIFVRQAKQIASKRMICAILCMLIAVGPHLLTIYSMMHAYAGLSFFAIIVAHVAERYRKKKRPLFFVFLLYILSAVLIDAHLWYESYKSGLVGKEMSQEVIRKTGEPVKTVYLIIIEDDYSKLSSFCVVPSDAFGWGRAAQFETNYQWPEVISDTTIERSSHARQDAEKLAKNILSKKEYECVWLVDHKTVDVIRE